MDSLGGHGPGLPATEQGRLPELRTHRRKHGLDDTCQCGAVGKWAVAIAVLIPLLYAATRWAWALGFPLGISEEFFREGQAVGLWWAGAGLATVAIGGALLTLGLVQRWGEVFPRWIPFLAGKRVPPALAIVPASLVSILVTTAGLMFVRLTLLGAVGGSSRSLTRRIGLPGPGTAVAALGHCPRRGDPRVLLP